MRRLLLIAAALALAAAACGGGDPLRDSVEETVRADRDFMRWVYYEHDTVAERNKAILDEIEARVAAARDEP